MKTFIWFLVAFKCLIYFFIRFHLLRDNAEIKKLLIIIEKSRLLIALVS